MCHTFKSDSNFEILKKNQLNDHLTRLDLHDHWLTMLIPHLPDVQQFVRVAVVPRPAVHEYPGAAAAAVHHQTVV